MEGQDLFPLVSVPSLFTQLLRRWGQEGVLCCREGSKPAQGPELGHQGNTELRTWAQEDP